MKAGDIVTSKNIKTSDVDFVFKELLLDYYSENKTLVWGVIIMTFLTFPVESIVLPLNYSKLFDSVKSASKTKILPSLNLKNPIKSIRDQTPVGMILTIGLVWIGLLISFGFRLTLHSKLTPEYLSFVRQKIFDQTIKSHQEDYADIKIGKHISRLLDFSRTAKDMLGYAIGNMLPMVVGCVSIVVYFFIVNVDIGLTVLVGLSTLFLTGHYLGKRCIDASCDREGYYLEMSEGLHDSLGNLMNVYLNNQSASEIKKNQKIEEKHTRLYQSQQYLIRNIVVLLTMISVITFGGVFAVSYNKLQKRVISTRIFSSIVMILMYFFGYLLNMSDDLPYYLVKYGILKQSIPFLSNILSDNKRGTKRNVIKNGHIRFQNVGFRYSPRDKYLYRGLNITIKSGEHVAIMGSSGSGKTTLMKLLIRMFPLTEGKILIDNTDIKTMDIGYLRSTVNYINQKTTLFNDSIINNIKYGNPRLTDKRIKEVIKRYNLETVYQEIEEGIYGNAGVHGGNLSLGMQKMTILLRGVFRGGKVLVFDEPLAGLDALTREKFIRLMNDMFKTRTVVVITHDPEIIPHMNRTIDLSKIKLSLKNNKTDGLSAKPTSKPSTSKDTHPTFNPH